MFKVQRRLCIVPIATKMMIQDESFLLLTQGILIFDRAHGAM